MSYVIVDAIKGEIQYWSNSIGWVSIHDADVFSDEEQRTLNLPYEGHWLKLVGEQQSNTLLNNKESK